MRERPHTKINAPWSGPWQVIEEREDNETRHPIERFNTQMCKRCNMDLFKELEKAIPYAAADNFEYEIEAVRISSCTITKNYSCDRRCRR